MVPPARAAVNRARAWRDDNAHCPRRALSKNGDGPAPVSIGAARYVLLSIVWVCPAISDSLIPACRVYPPMRLPGANIRRRKEAALDLIFDQDARGIVLPLAIAKTIAADCLTGICMRHQSVLERRWRENAKVFGNSIQPRMARRRP